MFSRFRTVSAWLLAFTLVWTFPVPRLFSARAQRSPASRKEIPAPELNPEKPLSRELKPGEVHTYRLNLQAKDYVNGVVAHGGMLLSVKLVTSDGTVWSEGATPENPQFETGIFFLLVAEKAGDCMVEVAAAPKSGAGTYEIKILEHRPATTDEVLRIPAQRWSEEGHRYASMKTTKENLMQGIEMFRKSIAAWHRLAETQNESDDLNLLAGLYYSLGDRSRTLELYQQSLRLALTLPRTKSLFAKYQNLGGLSIEMGEIPQALEYLGNAQKLLDGPRFVDADAYLYLTTGFANWLLGEDQKALDYFLRALQRFQELKNRSLEAFARNNLSLVYRELGEYRKAREQLEETLKIARELGDRRTQAVAFNNLAATYRSEENNSKALEYFQQALPLTRETGDRSLEAKALINIGLALSVQEHYEKALESLNQALPLCQATKSRQLEGEVYLAFGVVNYKQGKDPEAVTHLEKALAVQRVLQNPGVEAGTLLSLAKVKRRMGSLKAALELVQEAIQKVELMRSRVATQEMKSSYVATVQGYYTFYIDLLLEMHKGQPQAGFDQEALKTSEQARARSLLELLTESRVDIFQGVDPTLLAKERNCKDRLSIKLGNLTKLVAGQHTVEQETEAKTEIDALTAEYQQIEAEIRRKNPRYATLTQPQPLTVTEIQNQVLDHDTLLLEYSLGEERSFVFVLSNQALKVFELPERKEIETLAQSLYVRLKKSGQPATAQTKTRQVTRADDESFPAIQAEIDHLSRMILGPIEAELGTKRLLIVPDGALHYIPFGALSEHVGLEVPPQTSKIRNPKPAHPLLANHELVTLPSASALAILRKETINRPPAAKTLAILADPVFGGPDDDRVAKLKPQDLQLKAGTEGSRLLERILEREDTASSAVPAAPATGKAEPPPKAIKLRIPRLPGTRLEADQISGFVNASQLLKAIGFEVNRTMVTSEALGRYRYVHFATHSFLDAERPELSALLLSMVDQDGNPQDGFFRGLEVFNLQLPAELVTLSACETGLGKSIKGEGLVGLTRGFMYAGTKRIIVSLWAVNDTATAELMKRFYRKLLIGKERPAAALRAAQLEMVRDTKWKSPYFWAPFVLQGEYQ